MKTLLEGDAAITAYENSDKGKKNAENEKYRVPVGTFLFGRFRQVEEVKQKLPFDGELIEDVIKFHIRKMSEELTKVRPWKRRIYIHSWGYIEVFPYVFNPYSLYYDHQKTMKFIKKYQKEFNILKTKNNE